MTDVLKRLRLRASWQAWERLGERDPLWAVLSDPEMRGRGWDPAAFLATGEADVSASLDLLRDLRVPVHLGSALDFGSGAGRLSRALAARFESVIGVDASASMVAEARRLNGDIRNLRFEQLTSRGLTNLRSESFDFVYSRLVLQHIQPTFAAEYVREFVRVLVSGGVAMFSAPAVDPRRGLGVLRPTLRAIRELLPGAHMSVYALRRPDVERAVVAESGRLIAARPDEAPPGWPGFLYVATKDLSKARSD